MLQDGDVTLAESGAIIGKKVLFPFAWRLGEHPILILSISQSILSTSTAMINSSHLLQVMATSLISIVSGDGLLLGTQPITKREFLSLARSRGDGYAIHNAWLHLHPHS